MNIQRQAALILICWGLAFFYIRWILAGIIAYQLNNSALKKRKKGMTFKERLLYSRYREEIPKLFLYLYFLIVIGHPAVLFVCLLLSLLGPCTEVGEIFAKGVAGFDFGWLLLYVLAFLVRPWFRPQVFPLDQKEEGHAAEEEKISCNRM